MPSITKINGQWWGVKYNRVYVGESAEVLDLLEKYGALK